MAEKNSIPERTKEQRAAARIKAMETRIENKRLLDEVRTGKVSLAEAIVDPAYSRIRVRNLLLAVPGIGLAKAQKIFCEGGISENRRVQGLGRRQKEYLIGLMDE